MISSDKTSHIKFHYYEHFDLKSTIVTAKEYYIRVTALVKDPIYDYIIRPKKRRNVKQWAFDFKKYRIEHAHIIR